MTGSVMRERPIGDCQRFVLGNLVTQGGTWYRGCGWQYENSALTIQILDRLAAAGLVTPVRLKNQRDAYKLTPAGRRKADQLAPEADYTVF